MSHLNAGCRAEISTIVTLGACCAGTKLASAVGSLLVFCHAARIGQKDHRAKGKRAVEEEISFHTLKVGRNIQSKPVSFHNERTKLEFTDLSTGFQFGKALPAVP
jgi:hypothetical protein